MPILGYGAFRDDESDPGKRQTDSHQRARPKAGLGGLINLGPDGYSKEEIATIRLYII